jgi:hypothetical protein
MRAEGERRLTVEFGNIDAELVSLFQHMFTAFCDKVIKSLGEAHHAVSQVFEAEVDGREALGHGGRLRES